MIVPRRDCNIKSKLIYFSLLSYKFKAIKFKIKILYVKMIDPKNMNLNKKNKK